jgi:hypothetical protein
MLQVAMKYCPAIDDITANKALKLHQYKLDDEDWMIVANLLCVLKVCLHSKLGMFLTDIL